MVYNIWGEAIMKIIRNTTVLKADLLLLAVAFIWGSTFILVKNALVGITPFVFMAIRFSAAFFFLFFMYKPGKEIFRKNILGAGIVLGIFLLGGYAFQTVGLQYTTASNAGFITGLSVVMVPLFNMYFTRRNPGFLVVLGALSAAAGLGLLTLKHGLVFQKGDVMVLLCAVCFAWHIVFTARYANRYNPNIISLLQIGTVAFFSSLISLGSPLEYLPPSLSPDVWLALGITAIPATSLAILIMSRVQKYTTPNRTAIILSMEPVFSALTAWSAGGEVLRYKDIAGAALVFLGMILAELKGNS
jgi:drug/metabolite transporter (DMT)-like permease